MPRELVEKVDRPFQDFFGPGKMPSEPTHYAPGSPEKIAVMRDRASRGEKLHHPEDAPMVLD